MSFSLMILLKSGNLFIKIVGYYSNLVFQQLPLSQLLHCLVCKIYYQTRKHNVYILFLYNRLIQMKMAVGL